MPKLLTAEQNREIDVWNVSDNGFVQALDIIGLWDANRLVHFGIFIDVSDVKVFHFQKAAVFSHEIEVCAEPGLGAACAGLVQWARANFRNIVKYVGNRRLHHEPHANRFNARKVRALDLAPLLP